MIPRLIGLCGNPGSGKSEVQRILEEEFGVFPVDDGAVLREFAKQYLGLSHDDVYTQEGKARETTILGVKWKNRSILGMLGKQLEDLFGEDILPFIACRNLNPRHSYSFGSVRKIQGHFYREKGGVIIEITRPGVGPSPYDFDRYDRSCITHIIHNDGTVAQLRDKVINLMAEISVSK